MQTPKARFRRSQTKETGKGQRAKGKTQTRMESNHSDLDVEPRKLRLPSFLHVRKVQEKSQNARAARQFNLRGAVVVVGAVVLPGGVAEHLQVESPTQNNKKNTVHHHHHHYH